MTNTTNNANNEPEAFVTSNPRIVDGFALLTDFRLHVITDADYTPARYLDDMLSPYDPDQYRAAIAEDGVRSVARAEMASLARTAGVYATADEARARLHDSEDEPGRSGPFNQHVLAVTTIDMVRALRRAYA